MVKFLFVLRNESLDGVHLILPCFAVVFFPTVYTIDKVKNMECIYHIRYTLYHNSPNDGTWNILAEKVE